MSARHSNNKHAKRVCVEKPVSCVVCVAAGLPVSFSSTHFVKDRNGKVCCPTILSTICRKCHKNGHTESYCTVLDRAAAKSKSVDHFPALVVKSSKAGGKAAATKSSNPFADLDVSSDDEEQEEAKPIARAVAKAVAKAFVETKPRVNVCGKRSWVEMMYETDDKEE
jgi:hypothetical protein